MKQQITIKNILAIFIVVFGTIAIVFCEVPDMVLGALIGFIGSILQYSSVQVQEAQQKTR